MSDEVNVAVPEAPQAVSAVAAAPKPPPARSPAMDRILNMADRCMRDHQLRLAAEMYFEVMRLQGEGAPETAHARRRLMQIAESYERNGNPHQARGIYEQLL